MQKPKRQPGTPSRFVRRMRARLALRVTGYEDVPAIIRRGFTRPGSQNRNKH